MTARRSPFQTPLAHSQPPLRVLARAYLAPKVAVVIPCFNEAENLPRVLSEVQTLQKLRPRWEILAIVVNDGSTDDSRDWLDGSEAAHAIYVIHLPLNLGIGRAVQSGLQLAHQLGADVTLQLDGDGQHPTAEVPRLVGPILARAADVALGSRYVQGGGGNVSSKLRQLGTAFFSGLVRLMVGRRILDTTSGFRAYSHEATAFLAQHYPDDYPEVQALVPLVRSGFRVLEVGVVMRTRQGGVSSITAMRSLYYMIKVALATLIDRARPVPLRRPKRGETR